MFTCEVNDDTGRQNFEITESKFTFAIKLKLLAVQRCIALEKWRHYLVIFLIITGKWFYSPYYNRLRQEQEPIISTGSVSFSIRIDQLSVHPTVRSKTNKYRHCNITLHVSCHRLSLPVCSVLMDVPCSHWIYMILKESWIFDYSHRSSENSFFNGFYTYLWMVNHICLCSLSCWKARSVTDQIL